MSKENPKKTKNLFMKSYQAVDASIQIRHRTNASLSYNSEIQLRPLTAQQRFVLGSKFFAFSFIAALIFALIPILHFVLVPAALIIGLALFAKGLSTQEYRLEKDIECPQCQNKFTLKAAPQGKWPIKENCPGCRAEIIIEKIK